MQTINQKQSKFYECTLALVTCVLLGYFSYGYWLEFADDNVFVLAPTAQAILFVLALYCTFFAGVGVCIFAPRSAMWGLILQWTSLTLLLYLFQFSLTLGLGVIFLSYLALKLPWRWGFLAAAIPPVTHILFADHDFVFMNAALFYMFNLFAMLVAKQRESEKQAKEQASHLLRELSATQALLTITAKRDERLRIARDLHDLMGHHLTALNLQLEVAVQLCNDDAKPAVEKSQMITRKLLDETRHVVNAFRDNAVLDIRTALTTLTDNINGMHVDIDIPQDLVIGHAQYAEALFRSAQEGVTNALKHSQGDYCKISLRQENLNWIMTISDNGSNRQPLTLGNGLTGMIERIRNLDGSVDYLQDGRGMTLTITLPNEKDALCA
ncbi:histidine kinase [Aestuariibacter sp. AA17]|uniref:Histidine kinase n=1 Tax=Fluctibacter corallii TaxID=2984329 RepID=A0ABT3A399_9ALTE|nr:histidine kinase [Aestuariibacter sp. AA17]MCV2883165.1 histidine kinase [Aestuariibacter sp. AA17]